MIPVNVEEARIKEEKGILTVLDVENLIFHIDKSVFNAKNLYKIITIILIKVLEIIEMKEGDSEVEIETDQEVEIEVTKEITIIIIKVMDSIKVMIMASNSNIIVVFLL